jgi:hypothetical protein
LLWPLLSPFVMLLAAVAKDAMLGNCCRFADADVEVELGREIVSTGGGGSICELSSIGDCSSVLNSIFSNQILHEAGKQNANAFGREESETRKITTEKYECCPLFRLSFEAVWSVATVIFCAVSIARERIGG